MAGLEIAAGVGGLISATLAISIHLQGLKNKIDTNFRVIDFLCNDISLIEGYFQELKEFYEMTEFSNGQMKRDKARVANYSQMLEDIAELVKAAEKGLNGKSFWRRGSEQIKLMSGTLDEIRDRVRGLHLHILMGHAIFKARLQTSFSLEQRDPIMVPVEGQPGVYQPKIDATNLSIMDKRDLIRKKYKESMDDDDDWDHGFHDGEHKLPLPPNRPPSPHIAELPASNEIPRVPRRISSRPPPVPLKIPTDSQESNRSTNGGSGSGGYSYTAYSPDETQSSISSPGSHPTDVFQQDPPQNRRTFSASAATSGAPLGSRSRYHVPQPPEPPLSHIDQWEMWLPEARPRQQPTQRKWSMSSRYSTVLPYPDEQSPDSIHPTVQMPFVPYVPPQQMQPNFNPNEVLAKATAKSSHSSRWSSFHSQSEYDEDGIY